MNKQIRRLAVALLACYLVLFVQLNVLAVGRQQELNADPRNNRQTERDFNRPRGAIVAADGTVLARSVPTPRGDQFRYQREYPTGDLFGRRPAPEFEAWLARQDLLDSESRIRPRSLPSGFRALLSA